MNTLSRRFPRLLWLSAGGLLLALLLALGSLFYLVYRDWRDEQQDNLIQEVLWLEQSLRMHMESHQEWADNLSREISAGKLDSQRFAQLASFYRRENPALVSIERVAINGEVLWDQYGLRRDGRVLTDSEFDALWRANRLLQADYSAPYQVRDGKYQFDLVVPIVQDGQSLGGVRLSYQLDVLLFHQVPWWIASKYAISIQNLDGQTLASKFDVAERPGSLSHQTTFDPPGQGLSLRAVSYRSGLGLTLPVLFTLIVLLASALIYAAWRIRRHVRERAQAEQALAQEVSLRQAIEDCMKSGLVALGEGGEILRVNRAFCDMVGFSPEQLVGSTPPHPFWPADGHDSLQAAIAAVRDQRQPAQGFELRFARDGGAAIEVRLYATPLVEADGRQRGWIASLFDITEPKRQRIALNASHQRFLTVLNGLVAGVCVIDVSSGLLLYANPAFSRLCLADEPAGPCCILLPGLSEMPEQDEYGQEFLADGEHYWLQLHRRRIDWVNGESAWLAILTDISADKARESQEQAQQERFQNTSRLIAMGELASSLAHELNQPLTAINTYASGVNRRLPAEFSLPSGVREALQAIAEQAKRAAQIVSSIRAFIKKHEPQLERVDPTIVILRAVNLAEALASKAGVRLQVEQEARPCVLDMDPVLIEQVLLNLMKNAIEAMQEANTKRARVRLRTTIGEAFWRVEVADNGPGLSATTRENLFTPFYSTKADGMGIGLNICRSIVEFHRGEFGANSSAAGACVFWFTLPLVK
ncbi:PAS domain-containing sensor histidine kinase [Neisseriaceae bacterium TC5R-5]|nr:PAS domain-containing sensor histidine kinase [Neisseriaceae bacterium TC5R-5]